MAFAVKHRLELKDTSGSDWKVDILEDGFVGTINDLIGWGKSALQLKFRAAEVKMKHSPIALSSMELTIAAETDYDLIEFAYGSSKQFLVKIYYGTAQVFEGYILKGLGDQSYRQSPYPVTIIATDFISSLKEIKYVAFGDQNIVLCSDVLLNIIDNGIGISKDILDSSALFNTQDSTGATDVSMNLNYVNQRIFIDTEMSYYDVLKNIMLTHNCRFYQHNGVGSTDCYWMVDNLELHKGGTDITYQKRSKTDYSYVSDLVVSQPTLLHTDITPLATPNLSFIEAAREINVNSEFVPPTNLLSGSGLILFPKFFIDKWTEIGGGKMSIGVDSNGYAVTNSYTYIGFKGIRHLSIGVGVTGSLYSSSISGKTHDITIISDIGSGIYQLTFTNEFVSPPSWTTTAGEKLYIENRGVFEITTTAAGGSGTSTIRIRVNKTAILPRVGDRIIGNIDGCKVLEQTIGIENLSSVKKLVKDENVLLELELTYANQWYDAVVSAYSTDIGVNLIGIKAGDESGDTFNGEVWENLAVNTSTNSFSQIIGFPETKHEQFTTFKVDIPLTWDGSLASSEYITIALINGYAKGILYKSIKLTIKGFENYTYNLLNDANNDTDITLTSPLFKVADKTDNSEFASLGGLVDSIGGEIALFGRYAPKIKNVFLADQIALEYGDIAQVWKGRLYNVLFGNEIIRDPKNFNRNFQIQESVIDANRNITSITAVEIRPSGEGATIYLIEADSTDLYFDPHVIANTTTEDVLVTNNGNVSITVTGSSSGSHFTVSANQTIAAYESKTFIITSTADVLDNYTETISFVDTLANTNTVDIVCSVSVISEVTSPFNFKLLTHFPIVLAERYDFEDPQTYSTLVEVENIGIKAIIDFDGGITTAFNVTPLTKWILPNEKESFNFFNDGADEEGLFSGSYQFFDSETDNTINAGAEINVITGLRMWAPPQVTGIIENKVRIDGGDWIDITVGYNTYIDFIEGEEFEWYLEVAGTLDGIEMGLSEHGQRPPILTWVGTAVDSSHTLTFTPFNSIGAPVSADISILYIL